MGQKGVKQTFRNSDVNRDAISERSARTAPTLPPEEDKQCNQEHDSTDCHYVYQKSP